MKMLSLVAATVLLTVSSAYAAELATGSQISDAVSGNTVQGSMDATGVYTEFYSADGVVHGADYKAKWFIECNTMCWIYDGSPKDCWSATVTGDQVSWIKEDVTLGTGTILSGNPNNF